MSRHRTPLILVVEDDATTNSMMQAVLSRAGFDVVGMHDVTGALATSYERPPDLVLLDVTLPDGSGFEVCRQLQQRPATARTPVLFISTLDDVLTKVRGFEVGGVDYITKPIAGEELIARVRTHLKLNQAYETLAELQAQRIQQLALAQEAILPSPAQYPQARFHVSRTQLLKAGGDIYDVIPCGGDVIDYVIADTSGHDLAATYWTSALKTLLMEYAGPVNSPRDVMLALNSTLCRILPDGVFMTLLYLRLNRKNSRLTLVNAGHPPLILVPAKGDDVAVLKSEGDVVGSFPDAVFSSRDLTASPGDRLFLFTDGLVEIAGSFEKGLKELTDACAARRALPLEEMVSEVKNDLVRGRQALDDIVLMGVEV